MAEKNTIDELAKKHGDLRVYHTDAGDIAFRPPKPAEYQRFTDKLTSGNKSKYAAMRELVLVCRVHPDREAALSILDRYPGLVLQAGSAINELAGAEFEAEAKKG